GWRLRTWPNTGARQQPPPPVNRQRIADGLRQGACVLPRRCDGPWCDGRSPCATDSMPVPSPVDTFCLGKILGRNVERGTIDTIHQLGRLGSKDCSGSDTTKICAAISLKQTMKYRLVKCLSLCL